MNRGRRRDRAATVILFPAIAIDAPNRTWRNAIHDTKGHSSRVFFIVFFAALPSVVLFLIAFFLAKSPGPSPVPRAISVLAEGIGEVLGVCAVAAVVSNLYRVLARGVSRAPGKRK